MKLLNWEGLKKAVSNKYGEVVSDKILKIEDGFVKLHLENEVITVAKEVRSSDNFICRGYELLD